MIATSNVAPIIPLLRALSREFDEEIQNREFDEEIQNRKYSLIRNTYDNNVLVSRYLRQHGHG